MQPSMTITRKNIKRLVQLALIVLFLLLTAGVTWFLRATKPIAEGKEEVINLPLVEIAKVAFQDYTLDVSSQGVVQPKKRTMVSSELAGKVTWMSEKFTTGGQFEKDEVILRIDETSYQTALAQAQAALAEAEVALTTERARAEQARRDWQRLGRGQISSLALREPQIKGVEASIAAAEVALDKARSDLTRTSIVAPYTATVANKGTEIGNFLAPGAPIGEFFQTTPLEVRLPLALDDLRFVNTGKGGSILGDLELSTNLGNQRITWQARIDRTEGQVDPQSRSIYVISEIIPDDETEKPLKLQPGLFLDATISGKAFKNVARIPAAAFLDLERVVIVDEFNKLKFRPVEVLRRDGPYVYVTAGLKDGERLCVTDLPTMIEDTEVQVREAADGLKQEVN